MSEIVETSGRGDGRFPLYYVRLEAADAGQAPRRAIVMVHGGAHTGNCYLRTADGRPGWGPHFARAGWRVIVPDWPGIGGSADAVAPDQLSGELVVEALGHLVRKIAAEAKGGRVVLMVHSMSGAYGWRLLEEQRDAIERMVAIAPAPPGNIFDEPTVLAEDADTLHLSRNGAEAVLTRNKPSIPSRGFAEKKLVGSSTRFPRAHLDAYAASLQPIPWGLISQRWNIGGSQIKVRHPERLAGCPVLMMTGSEDLEHSREVDGAIADWLKAQGAPTEFLYLPDIGISGNGHMLMMEDNSDELADIILARLG